MIFNRSKKLRIISFLVILLTMVAVPLVGVGDRPAQAAEPGQLAPMNPAFLEFWQNPRPEPFYGYIPPPVDLSHLDEIPVERARELATFPSSFDWRDTGKVTSVKNQNPCGTCWCFGTTSAVESRVLIEESISPAPDYSEQNLACCTDPAWVYLTGNRCMAGGWAWLAADTLIKKGTRLESCDPYNTGTINTDVCDDTCQSIKMVTNYCTVADQATSPDVIEPIKNAIYNHGPVAMSYCHDDSYMDAGNIYYWPGCAVNANHLVSIVGWDDGIAHPMGGGSGAWIVKNSWGTGWGDNGYFYLCYGSASMCEVVSFDYKDYDSDEQIYYWDEAGIVGGLGNWDDYSGWMANIFSSGQNGNLTHVDFWTTSNNAQYEIYVYLDGNISDGLQNLAASQSGSCQEFGYYSIALTSPVSLTNGQPFTIAVEVTTTGYKYPLPAEYQQTGLVDPPIQSGKSFYRHGDSDSWIDAAGPGCNLCLRARVMSEAAGEPDITVSPTSFEKTLLPGTSQDYTLNIGNAGGEALTYTISDEDESGPTAPAASMKLLSQPASMVLEIPLEGALVGAEETGGVGNGWQDIMTEDFEGAFPGTAWSVFPNAGATDAYWGKDGYRNHTGGGSYSAFCAKSGTAGGNPPTVYPDDMNAWMVYGPFSLADATDAELEYYLWLGAEEGYDAVYEMASTDGASFSGVGWTGFSGDWVNMSFDLTNVGGDNLCGEDEVWIAFIFQSDSMIGDEGAFIDDVVLRKLVAGANNPPNTPSNPSPVNHATGVSVDTDLSWTGGDPDVGDTVTYDVYFSPSASPSLVSNDQSAASYDPGALSSDTKYYWKIVATDNHAASTTGPVWDFTTGGAAEDCPWLDEDPKCGSVPAGCPADSITVSINTAGLSEGDYTANIVIDNNDPDENPTIIPVTLHVEAAAGEPDITVDPTSFEVPLPPDADWSDSLDIGNIGVEALTYTISDEETTGMSGSAAPPSRPSAPDGSNAAALPTHEDEHAPIQVFEQGNTLEELRDKIEQNGYNFTVDHNWVYDMSPEEKEKFFSRHDSGLPEVVDVSDDIGPLARYLGRKQLPSQFDWRNYDGRSYIGGIGNQGSCGSCYAFGACAAAEGTYNFANGLYDGNCSDFSESFIIWCLGSLPEYNPHFYGCEGADYDYFELTALTVEGVCSEAAFPYQTWDGCGDHWDAPRITLDSWHRIPCGDINAIKTAIMTYGPVDAAVLVTTAFEAYSGGIYEDSNTDCAGEPCYYAPTNHAIALVGWDDNGDPEANGYWILRNSWGSDDWGEDGYMRIKYRSAVVACEACYLVYSGADCSWLSQEPTSGSVAPGDPADSITVSINTAGLSEGDYTANIVIENNDPDENPTIVPVTLHVSSGNNPPNTPSNPSPADDATGVSINADLSWTGGDPDSGDTVTYDVHFGTSASPPLVSNDQSATTYDPGTLSYNTKHYWKIVATDHAASTSGPLWDFTTAAEAGRKGDFTGDGDIDIFDFVHFAAAYGSEWGDDNYNPIGDFANDGDIDIYDFVNFAEVYGT